MRDTAPAPRPLSSTSQIFEDAYPVPSVQTSALGGNQAQMIVVGLTRPWKVNEDY